MELNIRLKIDDETIDDILCTAFEGGINYWCDYVEVVGDFLGDYASEQISRGGELKLYDMEDEGVYHLTKANFISGIEKYISEYNDENIVWNGEIRADDVDAEVADIIIQLAIFGDIIYG